MLEIGLVWIVDAVARGVEADRIVLARHLGEPQRGVDEVELAVDIDFLELADQHDGRVAIEQVVARRHLELEHLVRAVA